MGCQGTRFTMSPGLEFLEAFDDHAFAGLETLDHQPLVADDAAGVMGLTTAPCLARTT